MQNNLSFSKRFCSYPICENDFLAESKKCDHALKLNYRIRRQYFGRFRDFQQILKHDIQVKR